MWGCSRSDDGPCRMRLCCGHDRPVCRPGISPNIPHGISSLVRQEGFTKVRIERKVIRESGTGMTSRRREIYEPSRAVPQYDPLDGDEDPAIHRLPRFIVLALLGLAGLATVV